jgi:hypothetical protein
MPRIQFTDGVVFDTDGPYRVEERHDGFYVVGCGMLLPVDSREEAEKTIEDLSPGASNKARREGGTEDGRAILPDRKN